MKALLLGCLLLTNAATEARPATTPLAVSSTTKIAVLFSRKTTFAQLVAIRQDLQKDNIELEYQLLEFDKNGELLKISFHVDCRDGFAGSAASGMLTSESAFGFYRDYTTKSDKAFQVGNL
jgi:hypothetical protein